MKPVEIAATLYSWGVATDARTHVAHGLLACLISLAVTLVAHTLLPRWLTLAGHMPGWIGWLIAGSYGWVAGVAAYGWRELEEEFRRWISGQIPSVPAGFRDHDTRWDVIAAAIGAAVPGPALAFLPDLVAAVL
jgi:hypothetical protein